MMYISNLLKVLIVFALLSACTEELEQKGPKKKREGHLVEVIKIKKDTLSHTSTHTGTLRASRTIRIFNQEEGRIEQLPYYEGDLVKKETVVARLDEQLLKAELNKATATRKQAELDLQRLVSMVKSQLASKEELARAETQLEVTRSEEMVLKTRLGYTEIRTPFDAIVSQRLIEPGDIAPKYTHILTLYDPESLVTEISVSGLLLPYINKGDKVEVKIDALVDRSFHGTVQRVHPALDERTRRSTVEVVIKPVPEGAMPGQFCRVSLNTQAEQRMVIPFKSLLRDRESEYVYVVKNDKKVERTAVRSGLRLADKVEIIEGLAEGDEIVTRGFFGLGDGMAVQLPAQKAQK